MGEAQAPWAGRIVLELRSDRIAMHLSPATRAHGREALAAFIAAGGPAYLASRDIDYGPAGNATASRLRTYLRHHLVLEDEVVSAVHAAFEPEIARTFARDLAWRSYAAGWLAVHPAAFRRLLSDLMSIEADWKRLPVLDRQYRAAVAGATGIACFDAWIGEALTDGTLHPRSRCAFASIWIFTLALPWQLGVRFMLRNLLDADLASMLLLWREVAGLDGGGPYLVSADALERLTAGRFPRAKDLATVGGRGGVEPPCALAAQVRQPAAGGTGPALLVVTAEDLHPESWPVAARDVRGVVLVEPTDLYGWTGERARSFKRAGLDDAARRAAGHFQCPVKRLWRDAGQAGRDRFGGLDRVELVATMPPTGPAEDDIAAACERFSNGARAPRLELIRRPWDQAMGQAAVAGKKAFEAGMDDVLQGLGLGVRR